MDTNTETALTLEPVSGFLESPRHDRLSGEIKAQVLELFRKCGDLSEACRVLNVEPRTIRWHRTHDSAFKEAYDEVWEQICDRAEGSIVRRLDNGHPAFPIFLLKTRRSAIYGDKPQQVNHNVTLVKNIAEKVDQFESRKQIESKEGEHH